MASRAGLTLRDYDELRQDIEEWIEESTLNVLIELEKSQSDDDDEKIGVLKYFEPRYLEGFRKNPKLKLSNTAGFTWGDGVYVMPLQYPKSGMIYGRIGVLGWYSMRGKRVYDATQYHGLSLYQEWITHQIMLYRMLTTTVHAQITNRILRNRFKREFGIHVIAFRPDERGYTVDTQNSKRLYLTDTDNEFWLCITDETHKQKKGIYFSDAVKDSRWVCVLVNEFMEAGINRKAALGFDERILVDTFWPKSAARPSNDDLIDIYKHVYYSYWSGMPRFIVGVPHDC